MLKTKDNISAVIAPLMTIAIELDTIIATLLRDKFSMSLADFKVLRAVHMLGGACNQLEVSRFNQVTEAAVSKRVTTLTVNNLINKQGDINDKRKVILTLTEQGKILMRQLQSAVIAHMESVFVDFSNPKRKTVTDLLSEILRLVVTQSSSKDTITKMEHLTLGSLRNGKVSGN